MASIYMNIEKFEPKGVATIKGPEGVYMAVKSYSWGAARNVGMDIGNMNNRAAGVGSMEKIVITREMDGGSNALLTSAYKFENTKGKKMTFVFLKPKLDGSANDVYYKVELTDARICSYNISCENGAKPVEEVGIVYTKIGITFNSEDALGVLKKGSATVFDVPTGVLEAGADLK
jgi:type VI secretion system secreted protein Hcp